MRIEVIEPENLNNKIEDFFPSYLKYGFFNISFSSGMGFTFAKLAKYFC